MAYNSYNYGNGGWFGMAPDWAEAVFEYGLGDNYDKHHKNILDWLDKNTNGEKVGYLSHTIGNIIKVKMPYDEKFTDVVNQFLIPEGHIKLDDTPKYIDGTWYMKVLETQGWVSVNTNFDNRHIEDIKSSTKSKIAGKYFQHRNKWIFEHSEEALLFSLYYL